MHDDGDGVDGAGDNTNFEWNMFQTQNDDDDGYEDVEFTYTVADNEVETDSTVTLEITLRGQIEYPNSTGLALWKASEVLAQFLCSSPNHVRSNRRQAASTLEAENHDGCVKQKHVLELGAGLGLCGIVAHRLGAQHVMLTDGDTEVLTNLKHNIERNVDNVDATRSISCSQLIWGRNLDEFSKKQQQIYKRERYDVILASDLVYMTKSLEPLWQTIDRLLVRNGNETKSEYDTVGFVLFSWYCSSQCSMEALLDMATKYNFVWTRPRFNVKGGNDSIIDEEDDLSSSSIQEGIYIFQRKVVV